MHLDQPLVDTAIDSLNRCFPGTGGIAAAMYTDDAVTLASVVFQPDR